jgi:hypothetical protein
VDPLAEKYGFQSAYAYAANNPVKYVDIMGMGPGPGNGGGTNVYVFDQKENPNDKRIYTADIFVQQKDGTIMGPYRGSSFPNAPDSQNTHKTIKEGSYAYHNKLGHKGGSQKGLNLIDENGNRNTPATTTPGGNDATAVYVNVHSGQEPNAAGLQNRGSEACITIHPEDVATFFSNFDWSGSLNRTDKNGNPVTYIGTSGNSSGDISIYRGQGEASNTIRSYLEATQEMQQSIPRTLSLPKVQVDATQFVLPILKLD